VVTGPQAWEVAATVVDPEIPVLTIADLGILREVHVEGDAVEVVITPTYSGCPAMDQIRQDIEAAFQAVGVNLVTVSTKLSPAWTTDWMSTEGKAKLNDFGIAPPRTRSDEPILCPQCSAGGSRLVSEFASTACKALRVCESCGEPFDHFKELR